MRRPVACRGLLAAVASLAVVALAAARTVPAAAAATPASPPRRGVWFCGDFESGNLDGWIWDLARADSAQVVTAPVRKGRYAVRITLSPGDIAASKERAELKVGDKEIERLHGSQGHEMWYGWSLFLPLDYRDPPGDQFQILGQWHNRPPPRLPRGFSGPRPNLKGPPPLMVHLVPNGGKPLLLLIGQSAPGAPPRQLGARPVRRGAWTDLVFHVRWSTGQDGFVEAWLDGRPFTGGKKYGPTLYSPVSNYLRLGLYRGKGVPTTNHVFYDEVRLGDSYAAVAP